MPALSNEATAACPPPPRPHMAPCSPMHLRLPLSALLLPQRGALGAQLAPQPVHAALRHHTQRQAARRCTGTHARIHTLAAARAGCQVETSMDRVRGCVCVGGGGAYQPRHSDFAGRDPRKQTVRSRPSLPSGASGAGSALGCVPSSLAKRSRRCGVNSAASCSCLRARHGQASGGQGQACQVCRKEGRKEGGKEAPLSELHNQSGVELWGSILPSCALLLSVIWGVYGAVSTHSLPPSIVSPYLVRRSACLRRRRVDASPAALAASRSCVTGGTREAALWREGRKTVCTRFGRQRGCSDQAASRFCGCAQRLVRGHTAPPF